ncbi:MAG: glycosyltransferase family 4 protein [archaeon]
MKIIFITRKYPPSIGGMERLSYEVTARVSKITKSEVIALKKPQIFLPFFMFYALIKAFCEKEKCVVHIGDGLLSPLGPVIKKVKGFPIVLTLHGLDVTFPNFFYQKIIPFFIKKYDKIICISNEVIKECKKKRIPINKCVFIPIGMQEKTEIKCNKNRLKEKLKIDLDGKKILLSVGRLVERKGFHWFLSEVLPEILKKHENLVYLIVGKGVMKNKIERIIKEKNLDKNVFLLGETENKFLEEIFVCSDIFVMPNIRVKGDMEGFGVVSIEAASYGLPVIASNLEGIKDAIKNEKNGFLLEERNKKKFIEKICFLIKNIEKAKAFGNKAKKYAEKNYSWDKIIKNYLNTYKSIEVN